MMRRRRPTWPESWTMERDTPLVSCDLSADDEALVAALLGGAGTGELGRGRAGVLSGNVFTDRMPPVLSVRGKRYRMGVALTGAGWAPGRGWGLGFRPLRW